MGVDQRDATVLDGAGSRAFATTYLLIEACGILCYWLALWLLPETRSSFMLSGASFASLWSLVPAEGALVLSACAAAAAVYRRLSWRVAALWLHAGLAAYASLLSLGMVLAEWRVWPAAGLMLPVLVVPPALAWSATASASSRLSPLRCVMRTLGQTVLFWGFFLLIVPVLLARAESALGRMITDMRVAPVSAAGWCLFAAGGGLGLWSGWTLAVVGCGTPLPIDPARRLVVAGPYRYLRNPMALSGVLQGVAVGLVLGSWLVVVYALCGALLWHFVVRPQEEAELRERFGDEYEVYRRSVRCWLPRRTAVGSAR